jgi:hypothetical protein
LCFFLSFLIFLMVLSLIPLYHMAKPYETVRFFFFFFCLKKKKVSSRYAQCRFLQSGPVCVHAFVRRRSYIERGRFAALRLFQPHWLGDRFYQLIHFSIKFFRWRGSFRYRRSFSFVFDFILLQSDDEKKKKPIGFKCLLWRRVTFFFYFS